MTRITDERLAELKEGWAHQASLVHDCSLAGSQYQSTCEDTAAALRELQKLRQVTPATASLKKCKCKIPQWRQEPDESRLYCRKCMLYE